MRIVTHDRRLALPKRLPTAVGFVHQENKARYHSSKVARTRSLITAGLGLPPGVYEMGSRLRSFEDLQRKAAVQFPPCSVENRADGAGSTTFPPNDFTQ